MPAYICATCGVQYPPADEPPAHCPICEDERQYVGLDGQRWTTPADLRAGWRNELREVEPGLLSIQTTPRFAIGQRALLARTPAGNVLWDCLSLLDDETYRAVRELGGISAIAISHPHFYGAMAEWSAAFDAPVYIHAADAAWVQRRDTGLVLWEETAREILDGVTLLNPGGHFDGAAALHWVGGAEGRGALLSGDTVAVNPTLRTVSFMYSYPNYIPLPEAAIRRIVETLRPYRYERIHGAWLTIPSGGPEAVERSAERYIRMIRGERG
jgi:glyoxylase-like metal-dependent hydrolase (beta-lactamase superfamily II)